MAFPGSSIVPKKLVESGHDLNAQPIGSGPFKFVSYQPRSAIKFERNPNYYEEGKPYFDAMEYRIISDITALTNAVMSGVNFSNEIPPKDWATVQSNPDLVGKTIEGSRYYWLLPNNTKPPLDNPKVRQAVAHAIDRQALVTGAFFGRATPILGGVIPQWNWGYADLGYSLPAAIPPRPSSSWPRPAIPTVRDLDDHRLVVPGDGRHGADHSGQPPGGRDQEHDRHHGDSRYWDEVWSTSNFDITTMYWLSPLADPDDFVTNNYKCGMAINVQKSCSKAMDDILERAKAAPTQDESCIARCRSSRSRDGHRAAGQRLDPDRAQESAELPADADRLPQDVEGRLVRIAADFRRRVGQNAGWRNRFALVLRLIAFRLLAFVPTLIAASLVLFIAINVVPGSAAKAALGIDATPQAIARFEHQHGLDRPLHVQYLAWLGGVLRGDFGNSFQNHVPVGPELLAPARDPRARRAGVPDRQSDRRAARRARCLLPSAQGRCLDHLPGDRDGRDPQLAGHLILLFALTLRWLPAGGYVPFIDDPLRNLEMMVMPALSLGIVSSALLLRIMRASVLEVLSSDYIRTARAKGATQSAVIWRHAMRNALIPFLTVGAVEFGFLFGGVVIIEDMFLLPASARWCWSGSSIATIRCCSPRAGHHRGRPDRQHGGRPDRLDPRSAPGPCEIGPMSRAPRWSARRAQHRWRRHGLLIGGFLVSCVLIAALFADWISPYFAL